MRARSLQGFLSLRSMSRKNLSRSGADDGFQKDEAEVSEGSDAQHA